MFLCSVFIRSWTPEKLSAMEQYLQNLYFRSTERRQPAAIEGGVLVNNAKKNLMQFITEVSFALDDVTLFLDTHPNDREALDYYKKYRIQRIQAIKEYENCYGPITKFGVESDDKWTWICDPWPWEGV